MAARPPLPAVLLKMDLAKAFDSVAWPFLLEVLEHTVSGINTRAHHLSQTRNIRNLLVGGNSKHRHVGFPLRWRDWISSILRTASTTVLVNGRPGNRICHARGLLFVIVMEVRNAHIHEADRRHAFVYADDLVIFLSPNVNDFTNMWRILDLFAGASGLVTNVDKCFITPIRCSQSQIDAVRQVFPCKILDFPTGYLGASLSLSRINSCEEQRLVDAVAARIPTWKAGLLTDAGHTTLT
ncbi:uncharacterized protein [Miscanthus floridulus]|uniref:uncharacterized protein n=1 Tax=Miscanthus floridulus TaxID=154761 RepID=UPI003458C565